MMPVISPIDALMPRVRQYASISCFIDRRYMPFFIMPRYNIDVRFDAAISLSRYYCFRCAGGADAASLFCRSYAACNRRHSSVKGGFSAILLMLSPRYCVTNTRASSGMMLIFAFDMPAGLHFCRDRRMPPDTLIIRQFASGNIRGHVARRRRSYLMMPRWHGVIQLIAGQRHHFKTTHDAL